MNLVISGKDFPLTPSLRQYVAERVAHLTHRTPGVGRVRVELDADHHHRTGVLGRAEFWVELRGRTFAAVAKGENVRPAIDLVVPKLSRQLADGKSRTLARRHGHHRKK